MATSIEQLSPSIIEDINSLDTGAVDKPWHVVLYNCDCHSADEVVLQLLKATDYTVRRCIHIMTEAHVLGRAIAYRGTEEMCVRCAKILASIGLRVEVQGS